MTVPLDDAAARRLAVQELDANILVEAGAGSGKTTLLVERAAQALLWGNLSPRRLLLITFMEKAAAEIRERIGRRLAAAAAGDDGSGRRRRARWLLAQLGDLTVDTIHGWAARVLGEFAVEAGLAPGFRVLSEREAAQGLREVWREWLEQAPPAVGQLIESLALLGVTAWHLEESMRALAGQADPAVAPATAPDLAGFFARLQATLPELAAAARQAAPPGEAGRAQAEALQAWVEAATPAPSDRLGRLLWRMPSLKPKGSMARWHEPERLRQQKAVLRALESQREALLTAYADFLLGQWLRQLAEDFLPRWRAWKVRRRAVTFDDLLWDLRRLLATSPTVRAQLHRRYAALLVDEFQDTDAVQVEILFRVAAPPEAEDWRLATVPPGRLFLVGDPKQAIYRFRGADLDTYLFVRERMQTMPGSRVIPITRNFRSVPAIVDYVNRLSAQWFVPESADEFGQAPFAPLEAARPAAAFRPRVYAYQEAGPANLEACRRREAEVIAAFCRQVVDEGWPVGDESRRRPASFSDLALLMPSRSGLPLYREVLEQAGIPLLAGGANRFFARDEIRGAALFLKAVWDPADQAAVVGWLRSPWVAADDAALLAFRLQYGPGRFAPDPAAPGEGVVAEGLRFLGRCRQGLPEASPYRLLVALRQAGDPAALAGPQAPAVAANLEKLLRLARESTAGWSGAEFVQWLWEQVQDNPPEPEAEPDQGEGVRFSSVHQAKGLEWPVVVVANWTAGNRAWPWLLTAPSPSRGAPVAGRFPIGLASREYQARLEEHRVLEAAERRRLFYVALTRARDYLLVVDVKPEDQAPFWDEVAVAPAVRFRPSAWSRRH